MKGRKKKYLTEEERIKAINNSKMKYYWSHKQSKKIGGNIANNFNTTDNDIIIEKINIHDDQD